MIDETVKKNVTLVVAAGNSHMDAGPLLMVSHPDVITVSLCQIVTVNADKVEKFGLCCSRW